MTAPAHPWFLAEERARAGGRQLVCFPYAGGSASIYRGWQSALGDEVEVLAVELPGRGTRFAEPPIHDLHALVARLASAADGVLRHDCVFFGHSNGALVAYALARELMRRGMPGPGHVVVSAKKPPHRDRSRGLHALAPAEFVDELRLLNGTPEALLEDPELLEVFAPVLRADFALSELYVHPFDSAPLPCAATLIGGMHDTHAPPGDVYDWQEYFSGRVERHCLNGDHFFVHALRSEVLDIVRAALLTPSIPNRPACEPIRTAHNIHRSKTA